MEEEKGRTERSGTDHKNAVVKLLLKAIPASQITKWTDTVRKMRAQKICWSAYTDWTLLNPKGIWRCLTPPLSIRPRCWGKGCTAAWGIIQTLSRKGIIKPDQFPNVFGAAGADGPTPARGRLALALDSFSASYAACETHTTKRNMLL